MLDSVLETSPNGSFDSLVSNFSSVNVNGTIYLRNYNGTDQGGKGKCELTRNFSMHVVYRESNEKYVQKYKIYTMEDSTKYTSDVYMLT